jgi:TIR domain/NB-ARC domain
MPKVFPCYSPSKSELARELAAFLERGAGVEVLLEEGEMRPGQDLIAKVAEGLSADVVLVLLSPDAVPARWIRERWTQVFWDQAAEVGTVVATLLVADCKFPDLLRRKHFFDLRADRLAAFRSIKRWLMKLWPVPQRTPFQPPRQPRFSGREAELEMLCTLLADAPGIVAITNAVPGSGKTALALEFAHRHHADFEATLWLTCGSRTPAALAGDLAAQLGARLEGDLESNLDELRRLCAHHRCLLVLDDAAVSTAAMLAARGRTSMLLTSRTGDLATALRATPMPLEGPSQPYGSPADLGSTGQRLLAAASACASCGFRLEVAARTAGIDLREARELTADLLSRGLILELDRDGPRYLLPASARSAAASLVSDVSWPPKHAQAVAGLFEAQSAAADQLDAYWPDLQCALAWALEAGDWQLARTLARRGVTWARAQGRLAEAFEILEDLARTAEQRADLPVLEECAWERIWILERWGRVAEARALDNFRRRRYAGQMCFEFLV